MNPDAADEDIADLQQMCHLEINKLFDDYADRPDVLRRLVLSFSNLVVARSYQHGADLIASIVKKNSR